MAGGATGGWPDEAQQLGAWRWYLPVRRFGGYFGAAQGVLVIGLLGMFLHENLQHVDAAKNALVAIVNGIAALVFVLFAHVAWVAVLLIAAASTIGGLLGARYGRRLPSAALRWLIVVVGVIVSVKLLFFS